MENLSVEVYGDRVPLRSLAAISVRDAQTLLVSPWDKGVRVHCLPYRHGTQDRS